MRQECRERFPRRLAIPACMTARVATHAGITTHEKKKLTTVTAHGELTMSSRWAHGNQNGHSQPWLSRDLGRDWAVT